MTSAPFPLPRLGALALPRLGARVRGLYEREALPIVVLALWTTLLLLSMPLLVVQDTFLAFVDGRLIAQHGLPHVDTLTYWSLGRPWTDQQWGAHVVLYELAHRGGLLLAVVVGIACVSTALAVGVAVTRTLGASSRSAAIALLLPLVGASWLTQVRTQSLALVPFVATYGLLALDARRPGRRVLVVLPLLAVWANLHGSVSLAAGLAALYGLTLVRHPATRARGALLAAGAPLCVLASPYGLHLIGYYRLMLLHPPLADYVQEWQPPAVETATLAYFASAFVLTALWARHRRVLTSFEQWAIGILLLASLTAVRNAVWFELAAAVTLPRLLDAAWPSRIALTTGVRRVNLVAGIVATVAVTAVGAAQIASPPSFDRGRSSAAASKIAAAAGANGIVLADDEHADWLLWQEPSLQGRIAYDVRFELFDSSELRTIGRLEGARQPEWRRCGVTARVVTFFSHADERLALQQGVLARGSKRLFRSPTFDAYVQPPAASRCARL